MNGNTFIMHFWGSYSPPVVVAHPRLPFGDYLARLPFPKIPPPRFCQKPLGTDICPPLAQLMIKSKPPWSFCFGKVQIEKSVPDPRPGSPEVWNCHVCVSSRCFFLRTGPD